MFTVSLVCYGHRSPQLKATTNGSIAVPIVTQFTNAFEWYLIRRPSQRFEALALCDLL